MTPRLHKSSLTPSNGLATSYMRRRRLAQGTQCIAAHHEGLARTLRAWRMRSSVTSLDPHPNPDFDPNPINAIQRTLRAWRRRSSATTASTAAAAEG